MLMTPISPNTMASPSAISSRIEASDSALEGGLDGRGQQPPALDPLHGAAPPAASAAGAAASAATSRSAVQRIGAARDRPERRGRGRALRAGPRARAGSAPAPPRARSAPSGPSPWPARPRAPAAPRRRPVAHLGGGRPAHGPDPDSRAGVVSREGVDERRIASRRLRPVGDFLERRELGQQRLAVGRRGRLAPVGGEQRHQGLVALVDLVADDDGLFLPARAGATYDAALAQRLEERQDLAVAGLAERRPPPPPGPPPSAPRPRRRCACAISGGGAADAGACATAGAASPGSSTSASRMRFTTGEDPWLTPSSGTCPSASPSRSPCRGSCTCSTARPSPGPWSARRP